MKRLHQFQINQETEVEVASESKNDAGETVITKKKEKQIVAHKFFIAKPTRTQSDNAQLYQSVEVGKALRSGMLSVYSIDKRYREEGVFTEEDNKTYKELCESLIKFIDELQVINKISETERTDDQKKRWAEITEEMSKIQVKLKDYENIKSNLYTHSAEYRARNLTITWWVLNLSYKEENNKETPFFTGNTFEDKLKFYDELMDRDDPFINEVLERFLYTVSFWIINAASKPEDFKELEKFIEKEKVERTEKPVS